MVDDDAPGSSRLTTSVTLAFLRDLPTTIARAGSSSDAFPDTLTTEQLVFGKSERNATEPGALNWCIADVTREHGCCFVEWCEREGLTASADGTPYFARVTHFVSDEWHASFPQLSETVAQFAQGGGEDDDDDGDFDDDGGGVGDGKG